MKASTRMDAETKDASIPMKNRDSAQVYTDKIWTKS